MELRKRRLLVMLCCVGVFYLFSRRYKTDIDVKIQVKEEFSLKHYAEEMENIFVRTLHEYYRVYHDKFKPYLKTKAKPIASSISDRVVQPNCRLPLDLLVLILSAPKNVKRRLSIRHSWGQQQKRFNVLAHNKTYATIFVVGKGASGHIDNMVLQEANDYKDILFIDFNDQYRSLSYKTLNALIWAANFCQPSFLLKTDDDCYVNVGNLFSFFDTRPEDTPLYTGRVQWFMPPNRDPLSKFYISELDYKKLLLPPYVSGGGILLSGGLLPRIADLGARHKIIPNEDANVGLIMREMGVNPEDNIRILPFIYCNVSLWSRPPCDFLEPYVIHGLEDYSHVWIHYHVTVLKFIKGVCSLARKFRKNLQPPTYCPTDNTV